MTTPSQIPSLYAEPSQKCDIFERLNIVIFAVKKIVSFFFFHFISYLQASTEHSTYNSGTKTILRIIDKRKEMVQDQVLTKGNFFEKYSLTSCI